MGLSNDLMTQFAKATIDKTTKKETTVYGTVVRYEDKYYVQIDGSDRLTPMPSTAHALPDDRVSIKIKNHTATITGNVSSPAPRVSKVEDINGQVKVYIPELEADIATIDHLDANYIKTKELDAINGRFETLEAEDLTINGKLTANEAKFESIDAKFADIDALSADYAKIGDLDAATGRIDILESDVADIDNLMFGSASGKVVHSDFANMLVQQINQALITDAMIKSVSADAITAGTIDANTVSIVSEDGRLVLEKEQIKISDESGNIRVLIGDTKRDGNDIDDKDRYCICIWDADGNPIFDATGITEYAVRDELIKTSMIADAAITAGKIDMESLFSEINKEDGTQYIKSSKVYFDDEEQTLDVTFKQMVTDVEGLSEDVSSHGTQLSVIQGQIDSKIWQQDIDSAKGEMSTKYSELEQTVDGFKTSVRETYATKDDLENIEIGNIEVGGRNLLVDTNTSKSVEHFITWDPDETTVNISYRESETNIVTDYTGVVDIFAGYAANLHVFYKGALCEWLKLNSDYTVSFDIALDCIYSGDSYMSTMQIGIGNTQSQNMQAPFVTSSEFDTAHTMWQKVTCNLRTGNIPSHTPLTEQALCIIFGEAMYVNAISIKNLKLEEGTTATAWTPAPENNATKKELQDFIQNDYSVFTQDLGGFKMYVESTYASKDDLNEIGGRNLLIDTNTEQSVAHILTWSPSETSFKVIYSYTVDDNDNESSTSVYSGAIKVTSSTNNPVENAYVFYKGALLKMLDPDTNYVLSMDIQTDMPDNETVMAGICDAQSLNVQAEFTQPSIRSNVNAWTHIEFLLHTVSESDMPEDHTLPEQCISLWFGKASLIYIKNLKLEVGTKSTDWSPAPEETLSNSYFERKFTDFRVDIDQGIVSEVGKYVDSFVGRNYLVGTSETPKEYTFTGWQKFLYEESTNTKEFDLSAGFISKLDKNTYVTLTADVEHVSGPNQVGLMFMLYTSVDDNGDGEGDIKQYNPFYMSPSESVVLFPGEHGRIRTRVPIELDQENISSVAIAICHDNDATEATTVKIHSVKLELGMMATDWNPAPEDTVSKSTLQQTAAALTFSINGAAKTATNHFKMEGAGLVVGDMREDGTLEDNILVRPNGIDIRDGDGVHATLERNKIILGQRSTDAEVDILNGAFKIAYIVDEKGQLDKNGEFGIYGTTKAGYSRLAFQPINENGNLTIGYGGYDAATKGLWDKLFNNKQDIEAKNASGTHIYGNKIWLRSAGEIEIYPDTKNTYLRGNLVLRSGEDAIYSQRNISLSKWSLRFGLADDDDNDMVWLYRNWYEKETLLPGIYTEEKGFSFFGPHTNHNEAINLGYPKYRWQNIYAASSSISDSDRNVKKDIVSLDERYEALFAKLQPCSYKFINGTSGRTHTGFISQDIEDALSDVGLTPLDFAAFCKDAKTKEIKDPKTGEVRIIDACDEDGNPEYEYSLRYEEFIALNTHMIQKLQAENKELKDKVSSLEERLARLESLITEQ